MSVGRWTFALWLSTFSIQHSARADSVTLRPVADTTLIETAPNNNLGGQPFANSGTTQNFTKNRALFRFDVSAIPTGAQVDSVSLAFEVTRQPVDGYAPADFGLHRMLVSWGEGAQTTANPGSPGQGAPAAPGEATWLARFAQTGPNWAAPGGLAGTDFAATSSAGQSIYSTANSPYFFTSSQLAADVQLWLANPSENYGWMLLANDEGPNFTARRFGSREDSINAPQLAVQFTTVPEPSSLVLLAGAAALLAGRIRRK
ncbi:MAG: DNRLRE domain-containing protein [Verrucomicrobia bacterium]|nr:DNRLRE domain-containing protein [Verrucomicrobiota bacterium]